MTWEELINEEKSKNYFKELESFLDKRYKETKVYPAKKNIFKAFELCTYDELKVVIIGQDPYHQPFQAQGLAFSTPNHIKNPPSMVNIIKEVIDDIGDCHCLDGDLTSWAKQGVLLINTVLTVEDSLPKSHDKIGWQEFTDNIIKHISENFNDIVFILWGTPAIKKSRLIDNTKHHILTAPHPSPLSSYRGFFGCKHFSATNDILKQHDKKEILW
ncbi:MAG: uracil-DNA glycosylase [Campylobacterota bacterium]|nr:uracil-DNA glycosylase [Campylobacterota bacterium]